MDTQTARRTLRLALTRHELALGHGDAIQQEAYWEWEWRRCRESYRYFQDHYCYIKLKSGRIVKWNDPPSGQYVYPLQYAAGEEWQSGESTIEGKARQLGETTNASHFALWDCMFHDAVTWNIVGAEEDAGKDILERVNATVDRLPTELLVRARRTAATDAGRQARKQDATSSVLTLAFGNSRLIVRTSTPRKLQGKAGKVFLDDFGKHEDQENKWHLLLPVIEDPNPANRGQLIVIFNGNGQDMSYKIYQGAEDKKNGLTRHFYKWSEDPRRMWVPDADGNGPSCSLLPPRSTAPEDVYPWYRTEFDKYGDKYACKSQYPDNEDEMFFLHGNSRFDMARVNVVRRELEVEAKEQPAKHGYVRCVDDTYEWETHNTGITSRLYIKPPKTLDTGPYQDYIVALDAAGGYNSSDYCVAMVGGVLPGPQVEQLYVYQAKVEPADLATMGLKLAWWYHEALFMPETGASGHGQAVVNIAKYEYDRIFKQIRTSRFIDDEKEELGWSTNRVSRDVLVDDLATWFRDGDFIMHDDPTLTEMSRFEINPKTGKAEAPRGGYDDLVICSGLLVQGAKYLAVEKSATPSVYLDVLS